MHSVKRKDHVKLLREKRASRPEIYTQMSKNRLQNTQWFEAQQIDIHNTSPHENIEAIQLIIQNNSKIISGIVTVRRPSNPKWISPDFIVLRISLTVFILTLLWWRRAF